MRQGRWVCSAIDGQVPRNHEQVTAVCGERVDSWQVKARNPRRALDGSPGGLFRAWAETLPYSEELGLLMASQTGDQGSPWLLPNRITTITTLSLSRPMADILRSPLKIRPEQSHLLHRWKEHGAGGSDSWVWPSRVPFSVWVQSSHVLQGYEHSDTLIFLAMAENACTQMLGCQATISTENAITVRESRGSKPTSPTGQEEAGCLLSISSSLNHQTWG